MKNAASLALLSLLLGNAAIASEPQAQITLALNSHSAAVYTLNAFEPAADKSVEQSVQKAITEMSAQITKELEEKITRDLSHVIQ